MIDAPRKEIEVLYVTDLWNWTCAWDAKVLTDGILSQESTSCLSNISPVLSLRGDGKPRINLLVYDVTTLSAWMKAPELISNTGNTWALRATAIVSQNRSLSSGCPVSSTRHPSGFWLTLWVVITQYISTLNLRCPPAACTESTVS